MSAALAQALALHRAGDLVAAERGYRQHLGDRPADPEAAHHLALLLLQTARPRQAQDMLTAVLAAQPQRFDSAVALALACRQLGDLERGIAAARQALALRRDDPAAQALLGSLLVMAGDFEQGAQHLQRALAIEPDHPDAAHYLGIARHRQQRWQEALSAYREAARLRPADFRLLFNAALCAESLGDFAAAEQALVRARTLAPERADLLARLAHVQAMTCRFGAESASIAALDVLLAQPCPDPLDDRVEPFLLTYLPLAPPAREEVLRRAGAGLAREARMLGGALPARSRAAARPDRLRIGYLSAELGEHAVGSLMRAVFAAHDRQRVEVSAYSLRQFRDPVAAQVRAGCDRFRDATGMSTRGIAEAIEADGIDVLFDLSGFTLGARPGVLALRPAPVQIGYLGFIHSYGGGLVDYLLLDRDVMPDPAGAQLPEAVIRMASCFLPGVEPATPAVERERWGFPPEAFVLASFNNSYKLDAALLNAWAEILRGCPRAQLAIYLPAHARQGFAEAWTAQGGDPARLRMLDKLAPALHQARAAACDLGLDAFRYHAGATAMAAVAAGLPMLTLAGATPLSRMGVSINRSLGLDVLIARDRDDYVRRALALADDPMRLAGLRQDPSVASAQRDLARPERIARALEAAADVTFVRYQAGLPPQAIDLPGPERS